MNLRCLGAFFSVLVLFDYSLEAEEKEAGALSAGNRAFAQAAYGQLAAAAAGNLFFSPFSVSTALAMTYAGARGRTAQEISAVLRFGLPQDAVPPAFFEVQGSIRAAAAEGGPELSLANALWPAKTFSPRPEFAALLTRYYGAAATAVDFAHAPAQAVRTINLWVARETREQIKDLIKPEMINALTAMILTNAVYFKGRWEHRFDPALTRERPFWTAPDQSTPVPMMSRQLTVDFGEHADLQIAELPYQGGALSMVILLPRDKNGLSQIERQFAAGALDGRLAALAREEVRLSLPRFKLKSEMSLVAPLRALGLNDPFDSNRADFSGMAGAPGLFISEVAHQAAADVNEEGSEAAAATGVTMQLRGMPHYPVFNADRPFLFFIREKRFGNILFLGHVHNPAA